MRSAVPSGLGRGLPSVPAAEAAGYLLLSLRDKHIGTSFGPGPGCPRFSPAGPALASCHPERSDTERRISQGARSPTEGNRVDQPVPLRGASASAASSVNRAAFARHDSERSRRTEGHNPLVHQDLRRKVSMQRRSSDSRWASVSAADPLVWRWQVNRHTTSSVYHTTYGLSSRALDFFRAAVPAPARSIFSRNRPRPTGPERPQAGLAAPPAVFGPGLGAAMACAGGCGRAPC